LILIEKRSRLFD